MRRLRKNGRIQEDHTIAERIVKLLNLKQDNVKTEKSMTAVYVIM